MKRKLLEEGIELTLARALEIAENCVMSLDGKGGDSATVNHIYTGLLSKSDGKKRKQPRNT